MIGQSFGSFNHPPIRGSIRIVSSSNRYGRLGSTVWSEYIEYNVLETIGILLEVLLGK